MIINKLRPRRESSLQIRISPFCSCFISFPNCRFSTSLVPEIVSSIQQSILRFSFLQKLLISKRWFSTVCLSVETRIYPYVILVLVWWLCFVVVLICNNGFS